MNNNTQRTKAYLVTIVCHVLWGFSFMVSRTELDYVPVFQHEPFSWLSFVMCVLILIGIWGVQKTAPK